MDAKRPRNAVLSGCRAAAAAAMLSLGLAGCASVAAEGGEAALPQPSLLAASEERSVWRRLSPFPDPPQYDVRFDGLDPAEDARLIAVLGGASRTVLQQRGPAVSAVDLRRRAARDVDRLERALRSEGRFLAAVDADVAVGDPLDAAVFAVDAGPLFQIEAHNIHVGGADAALRRAIERYALPTGAPARSAEIIGAEQAALAALQAEGFAYAAPGPRDAVADLERATLRVDSRIDAGPRVTVSRIEVLGADTVRADFIRGFAEDLVGRPAAPDAFAERARALRATGLFRRVSVALPEEPPTTDGGAPVVIAVDEAAHRSIGAGLRVSTDAGPGVRAFWEHRNLLGAGETLRVEAEAALFERSVEVAFRRPRFSTARHAIFAGLAISDEETEAFERLGASASLGVERAFSPRVFGALRVIADLSEIEENGDAESSFIVGLPASLRFEAVDDPVDPRDGARARLAAGPYAGAFDDASAAFFVFDGQAVGYRPLGAARRVTLVGRGRVALLLGEDLDAIPANHRLYVGGSGSVRAYGSQRVGPLDDVGDPTGGLTAAEATIELRIDVLDGVSVAPFVDLGVLDADAFDVDGADIRGGPGLGVRYVSPIGVVRGDIAAPIDRRADDPPVQVYIGVGQEF